MTTNLETAISNFLDLGRKLQSHQPLRGSLVLSELTRWYQDSRILGAAFEDDADMLLLQWGKTRAHVLSEPTDMRGFRDGDYRFTDVARRYLDFTRQVFSTAEDETAEFDDVAVQMSVTLCYQIADGSEPSGSLWISSPDELAGGLQKFQNAFVASLLDLPADVVSISVFNAG
jgi:hypothetical protein